MKDLLRIASLLDSSGNYKLSDKLFKIAERGKLNLPMANREFGILLNQALVFSGGNKVSIDYTNLEQLIKSNMYLGPFISKVSENTESKALGSFNSGTRELKLLQINSVSQIDDLVGTFIHEIVHALDPGMNPKQQQRMQIRPYYIGSLKLSYEDNVKIQAMLKTAENIPFDDEETRQKYLKSYFEYPEALLENFDEFMQNYPDEMKAQLRRIEIKGLDISGTWMKKDAFENHQKQYAGKIGQISDTKYLDNRIEPVAWMSQIEREFSPNKMVRAYSKYKKINPSMTSEKFIAILKSNLNTGGYIDFIRSLTGSQSADTLFSQIKDPKIKRQMLEIIAKNISKADMLLKGGSIRISKLELLTLDKELGEFVKDYLKDIPVELQKKFYLTQDVNGNFKGNFEGIEIDKRDFKTIKDLTSLKSSSAITLPFSENIGKFSSVTASFKFCDDINCPKYNQIIDKESAKFCKGCGKRLKLTTDINSIKSTSTPAKATSPEPVNATQERANLETTKSPKPPKAPNPTTPRATNAPTKPLNSSEIAKKTSSIPQFKGKSSVQSISALSKVLPTIRKIFTELSLKLDKFYNTPAGKVFSKGMLAKDVLAVILLTNNISKQIENGEQVMLKDQMDLGLTIVSILTDQETHKILEAVYPPIIPFLENPEVKKWMIGINIGVNLLSGAITVTDYISTRINTTNKSEGATSGVMNTPGSLQALVMPVFQLREKYGEVYNALIDVEKGMAIPQAISKHIMVDASGGIEPYRLSLFYKFRNSKDKIIQYQNSPAFKKLPAQNQLLYPNVNSAYAISSYKKARDAARVRREEARRNNVFNNFGPGSGYPIRSPF
jgi:hypothetical protein